VLLAVLFARLQRGRLCGVQFIDEAVSAYMRQLCDRYDEPVLAEMEKLGEDRNFPIVGRVVGVTLELLARSIRARRVFEMGSGFGFSAYWFARAVGETGEVYLTDTDAGNARQAEDFLTRAGLWGRCRFLVQDAVAALEAAEGEFDIVYNDIDKEGYPAAWELARTKIGPMGLYLCDNVLWSGRVAHEEDQSPATVAIRAHNEAVYADPDFIATIVPTRDGVMTALRLR
jgi:predicted O-methyltransferase YrrM